LTFTPETQGPEPVQAETDTSSLIVRLAPGTWTIQAQGWNSKGDWETTPDMVMLRGTGKVQVQAGEVQGTKILLYPVETGTGVLSYTVQVPGDTVSALLRVYPLPENPDSVIPVWDLYAGRGPGQDEGTLVLQGSVDLPGGFYRAALDISRQTGGQVLVLRKNDTVHIYDSLTTTGTYAFRPDQFVPGETFTDLGALKTHLAGLPENTPDTPYLITLNAALSDTSLIFDALSRYVALDLRGSTGTAITNSKPSGSPYLTSIVLPEGIETLGDDAFNNCSSLEYLALPETLQTIGDSAFRGAKFSSLRIPQGVRSLGFSAFADCTRLTSIDLSSLPLTSLEDRVFSGCASLKTLSLPAGLPDKTVPTGMFYQCTALESLTLPLDIEIIGDSAFSGCSTLSSLELPAAVKTIEAGAFSGCAQFNPDIGSLTSLETIGIGAFLNCTGLSRVRLPASLTAIERYAFRGCTSLTIAEIPESLVSLIDYQTFHYCRDLQFTVGGQEPSPMLISNKTLLAYPGAPAAVIIPEGIEEIARGCFSGTSGLTQISIPGSLKIIRREAFGDTQITTIDLPPGLTTIEYYAFGNCQALQDLVCRAETPPSLDGSAFMYANAELKIYVPDSSVDAYKGADNWSALGSAIFGLSARP
jgi:hypothetical protein